MKINIHNLGKEIAHHNDWSIKHGHGPYTERFHWLEFRHSTLGWRTISIVILNFQFLISW